MLTDCERRVFLANSEMRKRIVNVAFSAIFALPAYYVTPCDETHQPRFYGPWKGVFKTEKAKEFFDVIEVV